MCQSLGKHALNIESWFAIDITLLCFILFNSGELCALEWKTSEKAKLNLNAMFDAPIQLCAYLGALNSDPRYDVIAKNGYVVVAYKNGDAGKVFKLSSAQIERYWQKWLERLHEYWIRVRDNTLPEPI